MKTSTYRVIISIGIGIFLLFFGVFIYLLHKSQKTIESSLSFSKCSSSQALDVPIVSQERRPMGFEYAGIPIEQDGSESPNVKKS